MKFEEFLNEYRPSIEKMASSLSKSYTSFDKKDLAQEAYCHLWELFCDNKIEGKNKTYILRSCWFYLKNYLRKNQDSIMPECLDMPIGEDGETLREIIPDIETEPKICIERLSAKILVNEIGSNGLTAREKEVFFLCLEGYTTREIGEVLGISHVRVVKIQKNIRDKYEALVNK